MEQIYQMMSSSEVLNWARSRGRHRSLSQRELSSKLGYQSDRSIGMVIKGQRSMSSEMQKRLSQFLKLESKELKYLQLIIEKDALESKGRDTYKLRLQLDSLRPSEYKLRVLTNKEIGFFQHWYSFTLLEIIKIYDKQASFKNIYSSLLGNANPKEVERTLKGFCELGIIQYEGGIYKVRDENEYFLSTTDLPSSTIRRIHKNQLQRAISAIEEQNIHERVFFGLNIKIKKSQYPELEKKVREFISELADTSNDDSQPGDSAVYQVNVQAYKQSDP